MSVVSQAEEELDAAEIAWPCDLNSNSFPLQLVMSIWFVCVFVKQGRACVKLCHPVFIGLRHFTYSLVKQGEHV